MYLNTASERRSLLLLFVGIILGNVFKLIIILADSVVNSSTVGTSGR